MNELQQNRVFVFAEPVRMNLGFDSLAELVENTVGDLLRLGNCFIFFNNKKTSVKVLFCEEDGLVIYYKRLSKGTFTYENLINQNISKEQLFKELRSSFTQKTQNKSKDLFLSYRNE